MTGYGFVFSTEPDLPRARRERSQVKTIPNWTLGYDATDPISQLLAERIALNSKDAGLSLQPTPNAVADLKVLRIPLSTTAPWVALGQTAAAIGLPAPHKETGSMEDIYAAEKALLASQRLLPLFHLPVSYAAATAVKGWLPRADGTWQLDNIWLGPSRP
jgi:hypothetical protein